LSQLASVGHLAKSIDPQLPLAFAETISLFTVNNVDGSVSVTSEAHQQNAIASVSTLQTAVLKSLVTGQKPQELVARGVRMTITKQAPHDMVNASLSPPRTEAEELYEAVGPSFRLPASQFACPGSRKNGAFQMGMMQWGRNPYGTDGLPQNSTMKSPLSRFSNTISPEKSTSRNSRKNKRKKKNLDGTYKATYSSPCVYAAHRSVLYCNSIQQACQSCRNTEP